jgi:hypothetical protein
MHEAAGQRGSDLRLREWPGTGSNRRPSDFQVSATVRGRPARSRRNGSDAPGVHGRAVACGRVAATVAITALPARTLDRSSRGRLTCADTALMRPKASPPPEGTGVQLVTSQRASGRRARSRLVVGLIPEAFVPVAAGMREALDQRRDLIEHRAGELADAAHREPRARDGGARSPPTP